MKNLPVSNKLVGFAQYVQERARANDTFKVPRFVMGPSAYNFMLWHLCEAYDASGDMRRELEAFIAACSPAEDMIAKECLVVVAGPGQNNKSFEYSHFLSTAIRTNLVLNGAGVLTTKQQTITYSQGDVFNIAPDELKTSMCSSEIESYTTHVVIFWTKADEGPIWEAYAKG